MAPDPAPMVKRWGNLSNYTHTSIYSQERTAEVADATELYETALTLTYLDILVECAYHVLNSHILRPDMRYFASESKREFTALRLRRRARKMFRSSRVHFGPGAVTFLRVSKRKWQLAPLDPSGMVRTFPS